MDRVINLVVGQVQNDCKALLRVLLQLLLGLHMLVFGRFPLSGVEAFLLVESFLFLGICF